ncbi:MAG TPA: methyltransferase domain-containing protein [Actinomycetota bacterium]|nr:methyltransferase domain-containing protein [Actinomycetota bacterium]
MSFDVAADAYDRFMGRYSRVLAPAFADYAGVRAGQRVLDVGCGPGALTTELVLRLGPESVAAVDPSEPFVAAARERHPGVDVRRSSAEDIPHPDGAFDVAMAQLVVHFLRDPVAGLMEMARVTGPVGLVAACVWDFAGERAPISAFWQAAREVDAEVHDESDLAGAREGHLRELFEAAGLREVEELALIVSVEHETFDDWWEPFELGVGPAGAYLAPLGPQERAALRERCRAILPPPPFTMTTAVWAARGSPTK